MNAQEPPERDENDWSAMDRAAAAGSIVEIEDLLAAGADPGAAGRDGRTPYDIAVGAGHVDVARRLARAQDEVDPGAADRRLWRPYCKAYLLGAVRDFPGWPPAAADGLDPETVVYLHDDLTVTASAVHGEEPLLEGTVAGWAAYCRDQLGFVVPDEISLTGQTGTVHG